MDINLIVTILFVVVMILNAVALVRHFWALRVLNCALNSFIEQQRMLNEHFAREMNKHSIAPHGHDLVG